MTASKRSVVVAARFTEAEASRLRERAGELRVSELVRDVALRHLDGHVTVPAPVIINGLTTKAAPARIWWECNAPGVTGPERPSYVWIAPPRAEP